jgi:hypothetical protein
MSPWGRADEPKHAGTIASRIGDLYEEHVRVSTRARRRPCAVSGDRPNIEIDRQIRSPMAGTRPAAAACLTIAGGAIGIRAPRVANCPGYSVSGGIGPGPAAGTRRLPNLAVAAA